MIISNLEGSYLYPIREVTNSSEPIQMVLRVFPSCIIDCLCLFWQKVPVDPFPNSESPTYLPEKALLLPSGSFFKMPILVRQPVYLSSSPRSVPVEMFFQHVWKIFILQKSRLKMYFKIFYVMHVCINFKIRMYNVHTSHTSCNHLPSAYKTFRSRTGTLIYDIG